MTKADARRILFDVNLLVALFDAQHVHHARAHAWWGARDAHSWASCPLTQNGCLRVLSQPSYPNAVTLPFARDFLTRQIASTDHEFWTDDLSILDQAVFDHGRLLGPKQITDVYLLALAVRRGGALATLDGGVPLGTVRGATPDHLLAI